MKGLKVVLPSAVADPTGLRKLEHYYGIEFTRGASNQGGDNGYHKMIGDESLLKEMRFHNQIKIANVKNAETKAYINQVNWNKNEDGSNAIVDGTDGSDIMQVHTKGVYAICGGTNAVYERYIVSDQPFSYDGDEAKYYPAYGETRTTPLCLTECFALSAMTTFPALQAQVQALSIPTPISAPPTPEASRRLS